ncbi:MAG TPA: flagellar motor switch protein FliM [Firmicutes bacterium]|nr:flagellar motor switch protein FliM [Bacillota bacterium]
MFDSPPSGRAATFCHKGVGALGKDVLSQSEIDSLISALSSGKIAEVEKEDDEAAEYRDYDFRRPSKFSKEQIRTLQFLHENYARSLTNFLAAYLRVPVQIQFASVSQVTYEEFVFSLPVPTLVTVFKMSEEMGSSMLETNPSFVFPIIDIVFGGGGQVPKNLREFTDIEVTVMKQINSHLLDNLRYTWEDIVPLNPRVESMDVNPQFSQMFASTETVILLTFTTQIKENEGLINLCFPYITLEKIIPRLTSQYWFKQGSMAASQFNEGIILGLIGEVEAELSAVLGQTTVTLDEFLQFREGDIIRLSQMEGDDLDILIENQPLFKGQPGAAGQHLAIQITRWMDKEGTETGG